MMNSTGTLQTCLLDCVFTTSSPIVHLLFFTLFQFDHVVDPQDSDCSLSCKLQQFQKPSVSSLAAAHVWVTERHARAARVDSRLEARCSLAITWMILVLARAGSSTPASTLFMTAPLMRSRPN